MCVCVCFWGSVYLKFLLRDDFESLIYWLDHWLSCMLDCIHVCVFHFLKNCLKKKKASSTPPRYLAICQELLKIYIKDKRNPVLTFLDLSLDRSVFSPPKPLSFTPNPLPSDFRAFSSFLFTWYVSFLSFTCIFHVLKPKFWGFLKILGIFKINVFVKIWDRFLLKWV